MDDTKKKTEINQRSKSCEIGKWKKTTKIMHELEYHTVWENLKIWSVSENKKKL